MASSTETIMEAYYNWKKNKNKQSLSYLLKKLEPIINSEASRFKGSDVIIKKKARLLAINAIKTYNPKSNVKLTSWVVSQLQPLSRYSTKLARPVQVSELAWKQYLQIENAKKQFEYEHGREPAPEELADKLGISVKRINKIQEMVPSYTHIGTAEQSVKEDENLGGGSQAVVELGEMDPKIREAVEFVHSSVDDRDKQILEYKIGYKDKPMLSNQEIAKKLGVTPAFVTMRSKDLGELIAKQVAK